MLIFQGVPPIKGTIKQLLIFHVPKPSIQSTDFFFLNSKAKVFSHGIEIIPAAGVTKASLNGEVDKDYLIGG